MEWGNWSDGRLRLGETNDWAVVEFKSVRTGHGLREVWPRGWSRRMRRWVLGVSLLVALISWPYPLFMPTMALLLLGTALVLSGFLLFVQWPLSLLIRRRQLRRDVTARR